MLKVGGIAVNRSGYTSLLSIGICKLLHKLVYGCICKLCGNQLFVIHSLFQFSSTFQNILQFKLKSGLYLHRTLCIILQ